MGSGEGKQRFIENRGDFGASDAALTDEQVGSVARGAQLVPVAGGCNALAYNLEGLSDSLRLPRDAYVDIFMGKAKDWADTRIAEAKSRG